MLKREVTTIKAKFTDFCVFMTERKTRNLKKEANMQLSILTE